jgi:predicted outer membrane repeat protein
VIFQGHNTFKNNSAPSGGALQLVDSSYMYLEPHTQILFIGNHAGYVGGAIYIDNSGSDQCFFHADSNSTGTIEINFYGNTATFAGSSVFEGGSGTIGSCERFNDFFNISNTETNPSAISSNPLKVCFCEDGKYQPDCSYTHRSINVFPGQGFPLRLALVGSGIFDGVVPGAFRAFINSSNATLESSQAFQRADKPHCEDFNYSVSSSTKRNVTFMLLPDQVFFKAITTNHSISFVAVTLLDCPMGFFLSPHTGQCVCDPLIKDGSITCDINDQSFTRSRNDLSWMGFFTFNGSNGTPGTVFHPNCPIGYCLNHNISFTVETADLQCEPNRIGLLCGKCNRDGGYSLTLGSQECKRCSNTHLLLILPLAVAGVLLVVILFALNLTVTEGSINGLIFYANVIAMNHTVLFSGGASYLYVFLAWLNLDLGISVCLFDGLDGYTETWLQYCRKSSI